MQIAAYNLREKLEIFAAVDMTSWTQFITEDSASDWNNAMTHLESFPLKE